MALPDGFSDATLIGSGYFADVLAVTEATSGNRVALKRLKRTHRQKSAYRKRFEREIRITESLDGVPGIISILTSDTMRDDLYYTAPLATRNLLTHIRQQNSTLDRDDRVVILTSVVAAIATSHGRGILHRDISPTNVLVFAADSQVTCLVSDFGLGKSEAELSVLTGASASGYGAGLYVAPEQRVQLRDASTRSDVFSLGRLVDFVMTGRDPDNAGDHVLSPISRKCTKYDPNERYADAAELSMSIDRLMKLVAGDGQAALVSIAQLPDLDEDFDPGAVQHLLLHGQYTGMTYYEFIDPVCDFFEDIMSVEDFAAAPDIDIDAVAKRFTAEVAACTTQVGWPFNQSKRFYRVLGSMVHACVSGEVKAACFRELWSSAYAGDQWSAQHVVKEVLNRGRFSEEVQVALAAEIDEIRGEKADNSLLQVAPKGPIRRAIIGLLG